MMLVVVIALVRLQYFAGDPLNLELTVTNSGPDPIRIPHPGSGSPGVRLRVRSPQNPKQTLIPGTAQSPATLELPPGQSWRGLLNVQDYMSVFDPGEYEIAVELAASAKPVVSNTVILRFSLLQVSGLSYGIWADPQEPQAYAVWLARDGDQQVLAQSAFVEGGGHDAGIQKNGPIPRRTVEAEASDPITQSTNYHPLHDLHQWIFWRRANRLYGLSSFDSEPISVELPDRSANVIGPALMDRSHTADILLAAPDSGGDIRARLWLARFQDSRQSPQPRVEPLRFPEGAFRFAVALEAAGGQDRRHVIGAAVEGNQFELVDLMVAKDGTPLPPVRRRLELEEPSVMLADGPPAIAVNRQGNIRAAAVLCSTADARRCRIVEADFGDTPPTVIPIELPVKPVAARITYSPVDSLRRAWAIWTEDGRVFAGRGASLHQIAQRVPADAPRAIVSLSRDDYLIEVSPTSGVVLKRF